MAHIRQQIRAAAITVLTGLVTTASRVYGVRGHALTQAKLPALIIRTPAEASEHITIGADPALLRQITLTVLVQAVGGDTLDDDLDQIASEVEAAIAADVTLGGVADDAMLVATEIEPPDASGEQLSNSMIMTFAVETRTARSDPETKI